MSEQIISEGVIKERIDGLTKLVNQQFETNTILVNKQFETNIAEHKAILDQATKTNGNVRKLQLAGAYMKGAIAVIICLVVPVLLFIAKDYLIK